MEFFHFRIPPLGFRTHGVVHRRGRPEPIHAAAHGHRWHLHQGRQQHHPQLHKTKIDDPIAQQAKNDLGLAFEHPFGTLKDRQGHGSQLCRGLALAGAEMEMSAWAYDFTQLINLEVINNPLVLLG